MIVNGFFGVRYDAPAFDGAPEFPTPVGEKCLMCDQAVLTGESGVILAYVGPDGSSGEAPEHIECFLRSVLGSVAHLREECICFGGTVPETRQNYRQQARETMDWLTQSGMKTG